VTKWLDEFALSANASAVSVRLGSHRAFGSVRPSLADSALHSQPHVLAISSSGKGRCFLEPPITLTPSNSPSYSRLQSYSYFRAPCLTLKIPPLAVIPTPPSPQIRTCPSTYVPACTYTYSSSSQLARPACLPVLTARSQADPALKTDVTETVLSF
jgi:hypothetical protein